MTTELPFVEPIRTTRTFEAAIDAIVEGIERRRLRSGDRMPTETELAGQLGISKPTLRQALRILESVGVITVRPGKGGGIFLASELLPTEALSRSVAIEEDAVVDLLRGRRVLEGSLAIVSMQEATEDDLAELEHVNDLMRANLGDRATVMRADSMFHRALMRACHNRTLESAMRGIARELAPIRDAYSGGTEVDRETLEVHERQVEAMRSRSLTALNVVLHEHFLMLEEEFARVIGRKWSDLFGEIAEPMLEITQSPAAGAA